LLSSTNSLHTAHISRISSEHDHSDKHTNGDRDKQPYRGSEHGGERRPIGVRRNEGEEAESYRRQYRGDESRGQ